ncbi:unnamed protein product [Mytilus coruscus]|uniref:Uncharacterized protein n=1 Tax=Mytilus coruscus TaxID=42192 RepID=A0A6J8CDC9_MYTCO|nr:unnamed protein product [Mytilus coruscus]
MSRSLKTDGRRRKTKRKVEEEMSLKKTDEEKNEKRKKDDRKTKKKEKLKKKMSPKSETDEDMKPTQRTVPAKDDRKTKKRKVEEEMSPKSKTDEDMKPTLRAVPAKDEGKKPTLRVVPIKPRRNRKYVNCTECGTPQQNIWRHMQKVHKTKVKKPKKVISKRGYVTHFCPFTSRKTGKCQKIIERLHDHLVRKHDVKNGSKRLTTLLSMAIPVTKEDTDSEDDEMDGSDDNQPLTQLRKKPKIKQEKSEFTPIIKQEKGDIITISDSDEPTQSQQCFMSYPESEDHDEPSITHETPERPPVVLFIQDKRINRFVNNQIDNGISKKEAHQTGAEAFHVRKGMDASRSLTVVLDVNKLMNWIVTFQNNKKGKFLISRYLSSFSKFLGFLVNEGYIDEGNKSQQVQTQIRFALKLLGTETENFKQPVKKSEDETREEMSYPESEDETREEISQIRFAKKFSLEVETREEIPYPESEDETREEISDPIYSAEPLPHIKTSETIDTRQKEDRGKMDFEIPSIKGAESRNEETEKTPETIAVIQKQSECSEKSGKERIASFYDNKITVKFYDWLQRMPLQMTSVNARQHANQAFHVWRYMTEKLTIQRLFETTALNGWVGEALKTFQPGTVVSYLGSDNRLVTFLLDVEQIPQQEELRARRLMDHIILTRKMLGKKVKLRRTVIETEECETMIMPEDIQSFLKSDKARQCRQCRELALAPPTVPDSQTFFNIRDFLLIRILQSNAQRPMAALGITEERFKRAKITEDGQGVIATEEDKPQRSEVREQRSDANLQQDTEEQRPQSKEERSEDVLDDGSEEEMPRSPLYSNDICEENPDPNSDIEEKPHRRRSFSQDEANLIFQLCKDNITNNKLTKTDVMEAMLFTAEGRYLVKRLKSVKKDKDVWKMLVDRVRAFARKAKKDN